jgi:predicted nucleic-acid-binding Zn-ribbon protein
MRLTQTCPKCSCKRLAVVSQLRLPDPASSNSVLVLPAVTIEGGTELGSFETWICLDCGYTELYARNLDGIEALAWRCPGYVRIIDPRPSEQGPYR